MKKILIGAIAAVASLTASAESFDFTASFNPYGQQAFSSGVGQDVWQATMIPADVVNTLAGNKLTSINIFSPSQSDGSAPNILTTVTVFLSHDLYQEPFYTKDVTLSSTAYELNHCEIDPYTVEADKPLYIGWHAVIPQENCYYITFDNLTPCFDYTCSTKIGDADWNLTGNASVLGSLCIGATFSGEALPMDGVIVLEKDKLPSSVEPGSEFPMSLVLRNMLGNRINTIDIEYTVGDVTKTVSTKVECTSGRDRHLYLDPMEKGVAYFDIEIPEEVSGVSVPLGYSIAKINGTAVNAFAEQTANKTFVSAIDLSEGFDRNVVIEEATGSWCGYCPAGIVMMEKLAEKYTDGSVIRIGVHSGNGPSSPDPMQVDEYRPFISKYVTPIGFPSAFANREQVILPHSAHPVEDVEKYYNSVREVKAPLKVEVSGEIVTPGEQFEITANVTSAFDFANEDDHYRLSFVVVEDHVGPYTQENYFSASMGGGESLEGWSERGRKVRNYYFDDVARAIYGCNGLEGSLPAEFTANETYEVKQTAEFGSVTAPEIRLVAMIIDTANDIIVNAAECTFVTGFTGIDNVEINDAATDGETEYFNLQGVRVTNPVEGGLYIMRRGNEASKVLVK